MIEILSQDIPQEVHQSIYEQRVHLAVLTTCFAASIQAEENQMSFEASDLIFFAGWKAALADRDLGEITAEDL